MTAKWLQEAAEAAYPNVTDVLAVRVDRHPRASLRAAFIAGAELMAEKAAQIADAEAVKHNNSALGAPDAEWGKAMRAHWALQDLASAIRSLSTTTTEEEKCQ